MNELNHALGPMISLVISFTTIAGFVVWIKKSLTSGFISSCDLEELEKRLRDFIKEEIKNANNYIQTIDGKEQKLSDRISRIEGKLE
jgi:hypothetical protein